jgi:formate dehydrogenase subunit gamma
VKIQTLLLLVGLMLPQVSLADGPPKQVDFPQGVSTERLGGDLWREVRQRDIQSSGISQVKGVDSGILINARGDQWARFRMEELSTYGGIAIAGIFAIIVLFYVVRGRVPIEGGLSGRMVRRFTDYERIVHWTLAIVFLFLAITGLILLLGRPLLLPLFGKEVFSILASASKEGHNLFGPLFLVSLIMMLISFARRNIYEKGDMTWLIRGGGLIGEGHASGGFFNMGEKTWYWMVILIGLVIAISGLILVSPNFGQGRMIMGLSHVVHTIGAIILIAVSIGHMYLGSIGSEGALEGMKTGYVDINWADAHHDRWGKVCHEENLIISAEEYARLQGQKPGVTDEMATAEQGK